MLNVAEILPAGINTVGGTWALGSVLASVTTVPVAGAAAFKNTDPSVLVPPVTVPGDITT
jgi:hypothetical protein